MCLHTVKINREQSISAIVMQDYRTAEVFRRHGIGYCCGGKWPLDVACRMQGVNPDELQRELELVVRTGRSPAREEIGAWDIGFLINYICNVHHQYLEKAIPGTKLLLEEFVMKHQKQYPYLTELQKQVDLLGKQLTMATVKEEEVIFPYIRQLEHAGKHKEPYAALFVRTLRKPLEETLFNGQDTIRDILQAIRNITLQYTPPENACISHKVVLAKLNELDNDIFQHLFIEQEILFPKATRLEKELLQY